LAIATAHAAPTVFHTTDPVRPNDTVMALGDSLPAAPTIDLARLSDAAPGDPQPAAWPGRGARAEVVQASPGCLKFVVPPTLAPGVYAWRLDGQLAGLLNRPTLWWLEGDRGPRATPGGWLRACGLNLTGGAASRVLLVGAQTRRLAADGGPYSLSAELPRDLAPGAYRVFAHNGWGGPGAWSEAAALTVEPAQPWPTTVHDVRDFGADGTGERDDGPAIQDALDKAGADGGGIVTLPRGRYRLTSDLVIPKKVLMRGAGRELTCLFWPDLPKPPDALLHGAGSFALEDFTVYCGWCKHVIACDITDAPLGDVRLERLRVRADAYRGHLETKDVNQRLVDSMKWSSGGGDTVRLGGPGIKVLDCDLYGTGRCLYLHRVRGGLITGNHFYNGRWGWYCISGSDGLVMAHNQITGADLQSTGGGLNCLDGSTSSQNVLYADNELTFMHGWDREAMTTDAGGGAYFGRAAGADGADTTLAEDPKPGGRDWRGAGLFILDGKGRGQWRRVVAIKGRTVTCDRPWDVAPDGTSWLTVTMFQGHYLFIGNRFSDAGVALQLYGMCCEAVCDGNVSTRTAGFHDFGMNYDGIQPSWYIQWLNNEIAEGNSYRSGHDNYLLAGEAHLGIFALPPRTDFPACLTLGCVARGNRLKSNAHLALGGSDPDNPALTVPVVQEVVAEHNTITDSAIGVDVRRAQSGVLLRDNRTERVVQPVRDELAEQKAAEARRDKMLADPGPLAQWSGPPRNGTVADATGHGFEAAITGDVTAGEVHGGGPGLKFSGESWLTLNEPSMFNLQSLTLALWIKPDSVTGRHGLIAKRFVGTAAPFVLSLWDGGIEFEANDAKGAWSFNFRSPALLKAGEWAHVAAVAEAGKGVTIYVNGQSVATKDNAELKCGNSEPVILGREAWSGVNMKHDPCFFDGQMAGIKIWGRALPAAEIAKEAGHAQP
jgi:hypothetical protein